VITTPVRDGYTYKGCEPRLFVILCGNCGIMYGVPDDWDNRRRKDGKTFYCPNGCPRVYRETEEDRLKARLTRKTAENDQLRAENRSLEARRRAAKGQLTKTRKRIHNGVCPHCKRTFADVARHMNTKHAEEVVADGS
jgi:hypothetical protein